MLKLCISFVSSSKTNAKPIKGKRNNAVGKSSGILDSNFASEHASLQQFPFKRTIQSDHKF